MLKSLTGRWCEQQSGENQEKHSYLRDDLGGGGRGRGFGVGINRQFGHLWRLRSLGLLDTGIGGGHRTRGFTTVIGQETIVAIEDAMEAFFKMNRGVETIGLLLDGESALVADVDLVELGGSLGLAAGDG